jgi:hypothetical protein
MFNREDKDKLTEQLANKYIEYENHIKNNPESISDDCFNYAKIIKDGDFQKKIIELLCKYDTKEFEPEKTCYICSSGRIKKDILHNLCVCDNIVHYTCLMEFVSKTNKLQCSICKSDYIVAEKRFNDSAWHQNKIYFPFSDFYPAHCSVNIFNNVYNDKIEGLRLAILFLQTNRIISLINDISIHELKEFIINEGKITYGVVQRMDDQITVTSIYQKDLNYIFYSDIEQILMDKIYY